MLRRIGHFCQPLRVAAQLGLYLHPRRILIGSVGGARRIVSEDSESAMCSLRRIEDDIDESLSSVITRPLRSRTWSFLLIVCTLRIFTASQIASDLADEYRGILRRSSIWPSAWSLVTQRRAVLSNYLRTVIVTAAVYRGFGRELRLAANPLP